MASAAAALEEKKTLLDRLLRHLPADALETLLKVNRNVHKNPMESKYRRLKLTNAKIAAALSAHPEAMAVMEQIFRWEQVEESEQEGETQPVLRLPPNRHINAIFVRHVEDALEHRVRQDRREAAASATRQRPSSSSDPERDRLRLQMRGDRVEQQNREPITTDSRGNNLRFGGTVVTAKDLGIQGRGG